MSGATQAKIHAQNQERENDARKPKPQNVANLVSGDARAGIIGGFHDRHLTLVGRIHSRFSFNVPTGRRRG
jgi:hypothetical protein